MAGGALRVPRPRLRGRPLAQPAPEGRRVRRLPVHRAALPALRQARLAPERGRGRHLRRPRLPDHAAQRAAAADRLPVRALPAPTRTCARPSSPRAPATCSTRSSMTASTPRSRCWARSATSSSASRRRSSRARATTSCATSPTSSRRSSTSARSSGRSGRVPRPRAQQGALHRRGPRHLLRGHHRRLRARLGHARELQGGRRGPRGHERVGDRAPDERDVPHPDRDQPHLPAADADREHLRDERATSREKAPSTRSGSSWSSCSPSWSASPRSSDAADGCDDPEVAALSKRERAQAHARDRQPDRRPRCRSGCATSSSTRCRAATTYDAADDAPRARDRPLPRGRAQGFDVVAVFAGDGTVNEAANGLAGTPTALTALPGGSNNVWRRSSGSRTTSWTRPSTCSRLADRLGAAPDRPRRPERPLLHVRGRHGAGRERRQARRRASLA